MLVRSRCAILPAVMLLPFVAVAVQAQQPSASAVPSVASYLCTFAGKCDGDAPAALPTRDAPETKGFRLARPNAVAEESGAAGAQAAAAAPAMPGKRPHRGAARLASIAASRATASNTALVGRRADLMVAFDLDSARLTGQGEASARIFAQSLLTPELSGKRFLIQGHTDIRGGHAYNMSLSARRAQAVADFLVSQGVEPGRLKTHGYGPDMPLAGHPNSDPANRRVEAELLS